MRRPKPKCHGDTNGRTHAHVRLAFSIGDGTTAGEGKGGKGDGELQLWLRKRATGREEGFLVGAQNERQIDCGGGKKKRANGKPNGHYEVSLSPAGLDAVWNGLAPEKKAELLKGL